MKTQLPLGGVDVPSEENCELFAAESVVIADRLLGHCDDAPRFRRSNLIQAVLLHRCWAREVELRSNNKHIAIARPDLPELEAVAMLQRHSATCFTTEASDGHRYRVNLPSPTRETVIATELLCLEFARRMGLPVRPGALIHFNRREAVNAGVVQQYGSPFFLHQTRDHFDCFGLRECEAVETHENGKLKLPLSKKAFRWFAGRLVFDLLVLNSVPEDTAFRNVNGRAEPFYGKFEHGLLDADWHRYAHAPNRARPFDSNFASRIKSHRQLDVWIERAQHVDLDAISELVVKQPAWWYGCKPRLMLTVIEQLDDRRRELRGIVHHLVRTGYFRSIAKHIARVGEAATVENDGRVLQIRSSWHKRSLAR
jgi:hypothetical protein